MKNDDPMINENLVVFAIRNVVHRQLDITWNLIQFELQE
jgi:hypothetical protein